LRRDRCVGGWRTAHADPGPKQGRGKDHPYRCQVPRQEGSATHRPRRDETSDRFKLDRLGLPRRTHAYATSCQAHFERVPESSRTKLQFLIETDECTPAVSGISTHKSPCHVGAGVSLMPRILEGSRQSAAESTSDRGSERLPKGWGRKVRPWRPMKGC